MWKLTPCPPFPWISVVQRVFLLCGLRQEQPPFPERKRRQKPQPCQVPPASEELVPKPWPSFAWSVCPKHIICGSLITVWSAFVGPHGVFSIMTVKKQRIVSNCGGPSRKGKMPTDISAHATKCVQMSVCARMCVCTCTRAPLVIIKCLLCLHLSFSSVSHWIVWPVSSKSTCVPGSPH